MTPKNTTPSKPKKSSVVYIIPLWYNGFMVQCLTLHQNNTNYNQGKKVMTQQNNSNTTNTQTPQNTEQTQKPQNTDNTDNTQNTDNTEQTTELKLFKSLSDIQKVVKDAKNAKNTYYTTIGDKTITLHYNKNTYDTLVKNGIVILNDNDKPKMYLSKTTEPELYTTIYQIFKDNTEIFKDTTEYRQNNNQSVVVIHRTHTHKVCVFCVMVFLQCFVVCITPHHRTPHTDKTTQNHTQKVCIFVL